MSIAEIAGRFQRLRTQYADRDAAMRRVLLVREGKMQHVWPDLFPEDAPVDTSIVANMVDVAARDTAEVLAPLPTVNCSSSTSVSDKAKSFAEKRSRIANNYLAHCNAQRQSYVAADRYVSYGFVPAMVEIDWDEKMPYIRFLDSIGTYIVKDRFDRVIGMYQCMYHTADELMDSYPEMRSAIRSRAIGGGGNTRIEVVRYHDKDADRLFLPAAMGNGAVEMQSIPNPLGKVLVRVAERPGLGVVPRGQFDDVLAVQVAKSRFAFLALEAAEKSVKAPIAMPNDVLDLAFGPDAALRSATPEKIRRVPLEVPRDVFVEQGALDTELRQGSRYPDARNGNIDGNIVTGRGVQALMSGFDTQIRTGQSVFAQVWGELIGLAFEVDEKLWPDTEKEIRGNDSGTPYSIKYKPAKDIASDYSVDVQYGLMAGLDPNRALVFALQARGDKLISRDFTRRQMPFQIDAVEEEQKVDIEEMREALKQAVAGYAQAIPALAQVGQDPGDIIRRLSMVVAGRQKGRPIETVIAEAFAPEAPPPGVEAEGAGSPVPGAESPPGGGQTPPGMNPSGLMRGVAPGQAGMGPGGMPDMQMLLAGLNSSGQPNLQAAVSRRIPA